MIIDIHEKIDVDPKWFEEQAKSETKGETITYEQHYRGI